MSRVIRVWINGRFLQRKITGVERVARNLIHALSQRRPVGQTLVHEQGLSFDVRIAVSAAVAASVGTEFAGFPVEQVGSREGHAWEQLDLASLPSQDWVLSLCNTGPLWRKRQALMFHDAQVYAIPENFNWKFRLWYKTLFNVAGRRARFLLTNSQFSKNELIKYTGIDSDRLAVMHLGADHFQSITPDLPPELLARLPDKPFVLAVSSINPNKNFNAVVQALALMGDQAPPCVIVGQQYGQVFEQVKLDQSRVTQLGYVSDEALAALYQRARCLVFPSLYEGFGLPPVEAMLSGCPVIVSNTSSLPEVCGDAALYCDPHRPQTLADGISRLVREPALAMQMKQRGLARAHQFTWERAANQMLQRLVQVIKEDSNQGADCTSSKETA